MVQSKKYPLVRESIKGFGVYHRILAKDAGCLQSLSQGITLQHARRFAVSIGRV